MKIIYFNYNYYQGASGVHIHFIANEMVELGHECTVVMPTVENTGTFGTPKYSFMNYDQFGNALKEGLISPDTILHAWTPRENTRVPTLIAAQTLDIPYFVHLEDNERNIIEVQYKKPFKEIFKLTLKGKLDIISHTIHPVLHQTFIAEAAAVSLIMDKLGEFVPPSVPTQLIWPACEPDFYKLSIQPDQSLRSKLNIPQNACVIVYPGNVHIANNYLIEPLYRALPLVEAAGYPIRLVRCAGSDVQMPEDIKSLKEKYVISAPLLPSRYLPEWLGLADILVQPGSPNSFDEYRFPSKLPLFLASGRPVVLARTNLGRFLQDGENCLILEDNTPEAIAAKIIRLWENPEERLRIGHQGRKFAAQNFNWQKTAKNLLNFYEEHGKK